MASADTAETVPHVLPTKDSNPSKSTWERIFVWLHCRLEGRQPQIAKSSRIVSTHPDLEFGFFKVKNY